MLIWRTGMVVLFLHQNVVFNDCDHCQPSPRSISSPAAFCSLSRRKQMAIECQQTTTSLNEMNSISCSLIKIRGGWPRS